MFGVLVGPLLLIRETFYSDTSKQSHYTENIFVIDGRIRPDEHHQVVPYRQRVESEIYGDVMRKRRMF
jgi:hypothetical protein